VLDDKEDSCDAVRAELEESYDVQTFVNEEQFWEALRQTDRDPDVFIIDWLLPLAESVNHTAQELLDKLDAADSKYHAKEIIVLTTAGRHNMEVIDWTVEHNRPYVEKGQLFKLSEWLPGDCGGKVDQLAALSEHLKCAKKSLEEESKELCEEKAFNHGFCAIAKDIVDEAVDWDQFQKTMLRFLMRRMDCRCAALIWFNRPEQLQTNEGWLIGKSAASGDGERYFEERVYLRDLGHADGIRKLLEAQCRRSNDGPSTLHCIVNHFHDQPPRTEPHDDASLRNPFEEVRIAHLGRTSAKHLLMLPLTETAHVVDDSMLQLPGLQHDFVPAQGADVSPASPGELVGCVFLYDRNDGKEFGHDAPSVRRLLSLPLASALLSARDMPFRLFQRTGPCALFFGSMLPQTRHRSFFDLLRPHKVEGGIVSLTMEMLRFMMLAIAILIVAVPLKIFGTSILLGHPEEPSAAILGAIDHLVMMLTVVLVSMGLLILYQPKFAPRFAGAMPRWLYRFSQIGHLKKTILVLVGIIISIGILERFVATDEHMSVDQTEPLLQYSVAGVLLLLGIAVFVHFALHDEG